MIRRLSALGYIYEARLGTRATLIQEAFAILGIAVGVALLFASQVSSTSLTRAAAQLNSQLVGSAQVQLKARGFNGVSEQLLREARQVPGVEVALPILERQINLVGKRAERSADLIGIEPKAVKASGPLLRRFSARQLTAIPAIALPSHLADELNVGPLETIRAQVGAKVAETIVGATLSSGDIGALVHSPIAVTSIGYAQRLTGSPGRVTRIFVRYAPNRSREALGGLTALARRWNVNLRPSTYESRLFAVAVAPENKSEQLFSGISALVGFMFALNAMLITVPSRRKLIADLRPHGAMPTMTVLLIDAGIIGVIACVLGLALGDVLSIAVFHVTPGYLTYAFPVGSQRIITWQTVALAVGAGMVAAVAGVLWPLREVLWGPRGRTWSPLDRRRWKAARLLIGIGCLGITTFTLMAATKDAVYGNVALVLALLCLLPFLFSGAVRVFVRISRLLNRWVSAGFAVEELETPQTRVRYLAIAATAALAVFGTVEFGGTQANLNRGLDGSIRGMDSSADLWIVPRGAASLQTTVPFEPLKTSLASVPGVSRVSAYRGGFLDWGERRLWVIAPDSSVEQPIPTGQLLNGAMAQADARVRLGGWAVVSEGLASEHHLRIGQAFILPSPRPTVFRLAGTTSNLGWPPGAVIVNAADYGRAWGNPAPSAYQIRTAPGVSVSAERARVSRALGGLALSVQTAKEREQRHYTAASQGLSRLTQIRILILIAAILAVVAAMSAMIWSRREQVATLKAHGVEQGILWRSLVCESSVMLLAGCSIGAVFGLYAQLLGSHFLSTVTGFPIVFDIEGFAAVTSFAIVNFFTVAVLAVAGYLVVRVRPSTASPAF